MTLFTKIRQVLKLVIPNYLLLFRRQFLIRKAIKRRDEELQDKTTSEKFSYIYERRLWGGTASDRHFTSGHGSHLAEHVNPYVNAVRAFLFSLPKTPDVVDLGCGDFAVGSQIREWSRSYVACDVAGNVIQANRQKFYKLRVDFRELNIIEDNLPKGDVALIRQVFQHLSNKDITRVIPKLYSYPYVILTEFIPIGHFVPNIDQPTGVASRIARGLRSGILLTAPPFLLRVKSESILCVSDEANPRGQLVTTLYELT